MIEVGLTLEFRRATLHFACAKAERTERENANLEQPIFAGGEDMDERKASHLAAAFILRTGRPVGILKLMKLMYLADREAMQRFVFPITFDGIYAMQQGMMLSRTYDLMIRKLGTKTNGEWDQLIAPPRPYQSVDVRPKVREDDLDSLSRNDLEVIEHVWGTYGQMSQDELVHDVHHHLDEWIAHWNDESRKSSAVPVSYAILCETLGELSKDDALEAAEEITYFQRVSEKRDDMREMA